MNAPKRDHLIQTAQRVFAKNGFKGVSVDRLLSEAGVAKMTLYKGFKGKSALIQETLRRRHHTLFDLFQKTVTASGTDPVRQLLACFDAAEIWSDSPDFNGCYFVSALAEFGADGTEEARLARDHKSQMLKFVYTLCCAADLKDPAGTAKDIRLLIEGATVAKLTLHQTDSYRRARHIAQALIASAQQPRHS